MIWAVLQLKVPTFPVTLGWVGFTKNSQLHFHWSFPLYVYLNGLIDSLYGLRINKSSLR